MATTKVKEYFKAFVEAYQAFLIQKGRSYEIGRFPELIAENANMFYKPTIGKFLPEEYKGLLEGFAIEYRGTDLGDWYAFVDKKHREKQAAKRPVKEKMEYTGPPADPLYLSLCVKFIKGNASPRSGSNDEYQKKFDKFILDNLPDGHKCRERHINKTYPTKGEGNEPQEQN